MMNSGASPVPTAASCQELPASGTASDPPAMQLSVAETLWVSQQETGNLEKSHRKACGVYPYSSVCLQKHSCN